LTKSNENFILNESYNQKRIFRIREKMSNVINNTKKPIEECENCRKLLLIVEELREGD